MARIVKLDRREPEPVDVKMDVALFKIRRAGLPNVRFRERLFDRSPKSLTDAATLNAVFNVKEMKLAASLFDVENDDSAADKFAV